MLYSETSPGLRNPRCSNSGTITMISSALLPVKFVVVELFPIISLGVAEVGRELLLIDLDFKSNRLIEV